MRAADRTRVLVVEDDRDIASALALELGHGGYEARGARDGPAPLLTSAEWPADLVVLDLGLPSMDGIEGGRRLRRGSSIPILVLTARDAVEDRVRGLDAGADDYLTKPFSFAELSARMRALIRRGVVKQPDDLQVSDLRLDPVTRRAWRGQVELELSAKEFA